MANGFPRSPTRPARGSFPAMKTPALLAAVMLAALVSAPAAEKDTRVYLLGSVNAKPGKLEELHAAIRDHFIPQATKQGATIVGSFTPVENPDGMVLLIGSFASMEALQKASKPTKNDAEFAAVIKTIEDLTDHSKQPLERLMQTTDFSPEFKPVAGQDARVFELRTYTATPGNLPLLHTRFRDQTMGLFATHGMTNLWYWQIAKGEPDADHTLIYMLAHASVDAAKASFDAFRADPAWIAAKAASEEKGGGPLTVPDGVKSVFMKATDYSPMK